MISNIIAELNSSNSRLHKEAVLDREVNNDLLKRVFLYALDPHRQFYIRKIPCYFKQIVAKRDLDWALNELDRLHTRELTGNAGIAHLKNILSSLSQEDAGIVELIIAKDMKCGVSEATVNKTWPGLITKYPTMLAAAFSRKIMDNLTYPVFVQQKLDGLRFNGIVNNGVVDYRSRNGRPIFLNGSLDRYFIDLANGSNIVFDGELLFMDKTTGQYLDRKTSNGIGNKAIKGTISDKEADCACVELWDMIPLENFDSGYCSDTYTSRFTKLSTLVNKLPQDQIKIRVAETEIAKNESEIQDIYAKHLSLGHEGVIVKDFHLDWQPKRVDGQMKIKNESVCELKVVSVQPGSGKYEGMIGALNCESEDGVIKVSVGSGLKDADRLVDIYTGKIVSVKYNERIKNKAGDQSLFLPIFLEIRMDKDMADNSNMIE